MKRKYQTTLKGWVVSKTRRTKTYIQRELCINSGKLDLWYNKPSDGSHPFFEKNLFEHLCSFLGICDVFALATTCYKFKLLLQSSSNAIFGVRSCILTDLMKKKLLDSAVIY